VWVNANVQSTTKRIIQYNTTQRVGTRGNMCKLQKRLRIRVDVPVGHWIRIRADNFYLFNDLSACIVRTSVCYRRSCDTSTRICSLPVEMAMNSGRHTYDMSTCIRSTRPKDTGRCTFGTSARIYSPCATDAGKQGELDLCRYLHIGIGLATVHRCPQLLASLENSSAEL